MPKSPQKIYRALEHVFCKLNNNDVMFNSISEPDVALAAQALRQVPLLTNYDENEKKRQFYESDDAAA